MSRYIPGAHRPRHVVTIRADEPVPRASDPLQVPEVSVVVRVMAPDGVRSEELRAAIDKAVDGLLFDADVALKLAGIQ